MQSVCQDIPPTVWRGQHRHPEGKMNYDKGESSSCREKEILCSGSGQLCNCWPDRIVRRFKCSSALRITCAIPIIEDCEVTACSGHIVMATLNFDDLVLDLSIYRHNHSSTKTCRTASFANSILRDITPDPTHHIVGVSSRPTSACTRGFMTHRHCPRLPVRQAADHYFLDGTVTKKHILNIKGIHLLDRFTIKIPCVRERQTPKSALHSSCPNRVDTDDLQKQCAFILFRQLVEMFAGRLYECKMWHICVQCNTQSPPDSDAAITRERDVVTGSSVQRCTNHVQKYTLDAKTAGPKDCTLWSRRAALPLPSAVLYTRIMSVYSANVYSTMLIGGTKAREWGSRQGRRRVPSVYPVANQHRHIRDIAQSLSGSGRVIHLIRNGCSIEMCCVGWVKWGLWVLDCARGRQSNGVFLTLAELKVNAGPDEAISGLGAIWLTFITPSTQGPLPLTSTHVLPAKAMSPTGSSRASSAALLLQHSVPSICAVRVTQRKHGMPVQSLACSDDRALHLRGSVTLAVIVLLGLKLAKFLFVYPPKRTGFIPGRITHRFLQVGLVLTMPLVGGFSLGSLVAPLHSCRAPLSPHFTLIGSQDITSGHIVGLREAGWTFRRINRNLNRSAYTLNRCWTQWEQEDRHAHRAARVDPG
ncbi:hypothetical protein PR048_019958 [Dryococelus australis]|uniref:Uncharacterized protein n=1 Tax=Dryococelus australis TaxID=614101 RepID=A0ABQ9H4Y5_9NEOP|nr:hypothetical protein PR048_019958 [Dryococelus australis]